MEAQIGSFGKLGPPVHSIASKLFQNKIGRYVNSHLSEEVWVISKNVEF